MKFKFLFLLFLLGFAFQSLTAQVTIKGIVIEKNSQQPVEFATVMVADANTKATLTGVTTGIDGSFVVKTETAEVYLEISFIGFATATINSLSIENGQVDLGMIELSENSADLEEVVVRAEKSSTEFKLDKRVFNVGKDLSSTGASALEVLNNVPSVNVNIEGEVSLRGSSGVQILINGKPSVLANEQGNALGTITADMIEKVEVITNPSAKYDAEGTSGIINIVIKKEDRKGVNGSATINVGIPHNHSFGLSLNRRTEKFNLFSQLGIGYRELPNDLENINRDLLTNTTVFTNGKEFRNEVIYNVILGTDYHLNRYNVLTLSGRFTYEVEDQPSLTNVIIQDNTGAITSEWNRSEITEALNPKFQYEFQYKKDFKDNEEHTLLFSALGNFFGKDQSSTFANNAVLGSSEFDDQITATKFQEGKFTYNLDYTHPFAEKWTIETGAQYVVNDVSNDFSVSNVVNSELVPDPNLTNVFEYQQNVLGVYGTGAYEDDKWGLKLGLRVENTDLKTLLINTNEKNDRNFTNYFPTLHTSYKITEAISVQAGYSRRIYRPRLWDLNPFFNIRNSFSIRAGNPDLLPELTDSYEISSIYIANKATFNLSVYQRYTTGVIERVSTFENNVTTFKPINIGTRRSTGVEFNAKYTPHKKVTITGDFNYNYFNREGTLETRSIQFNADQWSTKVTTKFKFPKDIDFEITGHYQSQYRSLQGLVSNNLFADCGLRKKILKGKGVFNLSIRDIFASRRMESETNQPDFYLYNLRTRGRFIVLGFSYGFGKGEAMEYSGQKRR